MPSGPEVLFDRQKQFIGNASHEMQTPLAVAATGWRCS